MGLISNLNEKVSHNIREHKDIKWFKLSEYLDFVEEPRMIPIYKN